MCESDVSHNNNYYFIIHTLTETGRDNAKKGDQMEKLQKGEELDIDMNDPDVQVAATKIQASFRGHKAREDVKKHKDEEAAAVKIQAGFRGHKAREKVKEIKISQSNEQVSESVDAAGEAGSAEKAPDALPVVSVEAEVAEEPEKQEASSEDQVPDAQPDDSVAAEAEADQEEPVEQEAQPDDAVIAESTEAGDAAGKEETEEAPAETMEAAEKAEDAEEAGDVVADAQPDGADGGEVEGQVEGEEEIDLDMNDPELKGAVVKIQASFRGHKAREQVKALKSSESLPQGDEEVASEEKADDEHQEVTEGDVDKGDDDAEPSVTEDADADDSKPSED